MSNESRKNLSKTYGAKCVLLAALAFGGPGLAQAAVLSLGAATGYNAFVFSNFTVYNTDSEGKIAVGGNFAPANGGGFTIASKHSGDGAGIYDLVVGGDFTNTYASIGGGDVFVGGNMTWTGPTLPHNAYVNGSFTNPGWGGSVGGTINYGGTFSSNSPLSHTKQTTPTTSPIDFLSAQTNLLSLSATLASQTANGTTVFDGYSTLTLTGTSSTTNIFSLSDSNYTGKTINITAPAGSTVIVNVAGTADSFNGGSLNFSGVTADKVIFNFSSATALSLSSYAFNGTILAPKASFTGNYGQINGQLIANNVAGTTELHDVLFTGSFAGLTVVTATPEPSTSTLILSGVLLIGLAKHRKGASKA
jgi:choice-of-anchor A domain-containing protein